MTNLIDAADLDLNDLDYLDSLPEPKRFESSVRAVVIKLDKAFQSEELDEKSVAITGDWEQKCTFSLRYSTGQVETASVRVTSTAKLVVGSKGRILDLTKEIFIRKEGARQGESVRFNKGVWLADTGESQSAPTKTRRRVDFAAE